MTRGKKASAAVCAAVLAVVSAAHLIAATHYVWQDSPLPAFPYASWSSAAHTIQDAVNAADEGDTVIVTNGVYASGGVIVPGSALSNRVAVTKPMIIRSVNGPDQTIIVGAPDAATPDGRGPNAIRCLYASNSATFVGFTLSNGYTDLAGINLALPQTSGGGAYLLDRVVLSNCTVVGCKGFFSAGAWCDGGCLVTLCSFIGNNSSNVPGGVGAANQSVIDTCRAEDNPEGGGILAMSGSSVLNCYVAGNLRAGFGGALTAMDSLVSNCVVTNNTAGYEGALCADHSLVQRCRVVNNRPDSYGGVVAYQSTVTACEITYNQARFRGAGVYAGNSLLANSLIANNITYNGQGGGVYADQGVTILNCTIVKNGAQTGGGLYSDYGTVVRNSILGYNGAASEDSANNAYGTNVIEYCLALFPGVGNISNEAQFVDFIGDNFHVSSNSPCINAGTNAYVFGDRDLDGNPRIRPAGGTVDIGAYEHVVPEPAIVWSALALLFGVRRK